jgi:hypothetical protein
LYCAVALSTGGCVFLVAPPPVPAPPTTLPPPPPIASQITLPIRTAAPDLGTLTRLPCDHFSGRFQGTYTYKIVVPIAVDVSYEYWLAPITASISNDTVRASTTGYYWIDGIVVPLAVPIWGQCGHSGETPRHLTISASSTLVWDPDWHIHTTTTATNLTDDGVKCSVTLANVDLTRMLEPALQRLIEDIFKKFDDAVAARTQVQKQAAGVWERIQQPIPLEASAWLQLNPETVTLAPITTTSGPLQELHSTLVLGARPVIAVGTEPLSTHTALPQLKSEPVADSGFHLIADVGLGISEANAVLNNPRSGIVNNTFEEGDHTLVIRKITPGVDGDKVVLALDVHSDIKPPQYEPADDIWMVARNVWRFIRATALGLVWKTDGTLYAEGTPKYNTGKRTVSFPDADYDLATRNLLLETSSWVLHTQAVAQLRGAELPVGNALDSTQARLTQALHQKLDGATLTGTVSRLEPQEVKTANEWLLLRVKADGEANLDVAWH